ncbi:MAG: hypothetical protein WBB70_17530 [Desulfobacterales bacterium]
MNKDVKIFAIAGVIVVLCMTGVFIYAISLDAQWASTVLIGMIICAAVVIIVPVANFIYVRVKPSGSNGTEVEIKIRRDQAIGSKQVIPSIDRKDSISSEINKKNIQGEVERKDLSNEISKLTVKRIIDEINESPPFQKESIGQNYYGIYVKWEGKLWEVEKPHFYEHKANDVNVRLHTESLSYSIHFVASIKKYPELKVARRGSLITVSGKIVRCSGPGMFVELDVDNITFSNEET